MMLNRIVSCRGIFFIWLLLFLSPQVQANDKPFQWIIGEELTYKVKWSFLRLGTLKTVVLDSLQMDGRKVYHTQLYIDSNPVLFFVNFHSIYESYINEDFYPHLFLAVEKIDGVKYDTRYRFNYATRQIEVKMTDVEDTTQVIEKLIPLDEKIQDGMSLIFFARGNIQTPASLNVKAFYNARKGDLVMRLKGAGEKVKIAALPGEVPTREVDGKMNFKTIAGFSGKYHGWFATDAQAPPLKAELKVFIGNVSVELESWTNWQPTDSLHH